MGSTVLMFVVLSTFCFLDTGSAADPVSVTLYYESMCPYCRTFITHQLYPAFTTFDSSVLNITIIPYGNAGDKLVNGVWQTHCQHGPGECLGNIIQACVLDLVDYEPDEYMPFVNCMERNTFHGHMYAALHKCNNFLNVTEPEVIACANTTRGGDLNHQMGQMSNAAKIQYVPWIVLNGQHTRHGQSTAYNDLKSVICKLYTGPSPDACSNKATDPIG